MKICHVCYYNNSDVTFRLLMSGDINPYPGPVSASTADKINCLVMNARSLKSFHKDGATNWQSVCNLHRFQGLVYAENSDVICVNETWLNQNISNSEILHSGFKIFRRDRSDRGGGGVLIAIKTASFKAVKEFKPESEAELQQLEIIFPEIITFSGQRILFCVCYGHPNKDPSWMDVFDNFLHEVCDQFDNMVISGDFNLPDILWDSIDSASGVNEPAFIETLHDHLLTQPNKKPTRGNNILDLVITSVPNRVNVTDILSPKDTGVFIDHSVIIFQFNAFVKAPPKTLRFFYDYTKGDFEGLRTALSTINLSSIIANDDINTDWHQWKDTFLVAVSDYIQTKRLKGRNPISWMSGEIYMTKAETISLEPPEGEVKKSENS